MRQLGSVWPLAASSLRRSWYRQALMAGILGLAVAAYLLYATFLTGAGHEARLLVGPLNLPCDLIFLGTRTLSADEISEIARSGGVQGFEQARSTWYLTEAGYLRVVALPASSRLWAALSGPGQDPTPSVPGPGEALIPSWVADLRGLRAGDEMVLSPPRAPRSGAGFRVAGVHRAADDFLQDCALTLLPVPGPSPNSLFVWTTTPGAAASLAWTLERDYGQPTRPVLRTMDDPVVLTAGRPDLLARMVLAQTYMPGAGVMALVFAFCGIGLFTTATLGFLDRKRNIAILKTVGLESGGVVAMLVIEQAVVALAGAVMGTAVAALAIPRLAAYFPGQPALTFLNVVKGALAGALVLGAAVFLPAASARVATVNQLLYNLPVPLRTHRVSGQTGV